MEINSTASVTLSFEFGPDDSKRTSGKGRTVSASEYNSLRQLSKRTSGSSQTSYAYSYGGIDRASLVYDGNQLKTVTDDADYLSYAGANDMPNGTSQYTYDANGNMASDSGRGIASVSYDRLNLPRRVACSDGTIVAFSYDALGRKLAETDSLTRQV